MIQVSLEEIAPRKRVLKISPKKRRVPVPMATAQRAPLRMICASWTLMISRTGSKVIHQVNPPTGKRPTTTTTMTMILSDKCIEKDTDKQL